MRSGKLRTNWLRFAFPFPTVKLYLDGHASISEACWKITAVRFVSLYTMAPLAKIGIISIGEMGLAIAKLLLAHNYEVLTNITDRR